MKMAIQILVLKSLWNVWSKKIFHNILLSYHLLFFHFLKSICNVDYLNNNYIYFIQKDREKKEKRWNYSLVEYLQEKRIVMIFTSTFNFYIVFRDISLYLRLNFWKKQFFLSLNINSLIYNNLKTLIKKY